MGWTLAVAPATAGMHLEHLPNIPKIALKRQELEKSRKGISHCGHFHFFGSPEAVVDLVPLDCVSGTVVGPDGCPVPAADVTVYSVGYTGSGYSKVPRATVATGPNGNLYRLL